MSFFKYLLSPEVVAIIFGGILASFFSLYKELSNDKSKAKYIHYGLFFAGLIVIISGVYSGYNNEQTSKIITKLTEKNIELSQSNTELIKKNEGLITGGDSYVYLMPFIPVNSDMIEFNIIHSGEYPVFDISIDILDLNKLKNINTEEEFQNKDDLDPLELINRLRIKKSESRFVLNIGNMSPNTTRVIGPFKISAVADTDKTQTYYISIISRNKNISETIKARKLENTWQYAWKVVDMSSTDKNVLTQAGNLLNE